MAGGDITRWSTAPCSRDRWDAPVGRRRACYQSNSLPDGETSFTVMLCDVPAPAWIGVHDELIRVGAAEHLVRRPNDGVGELRVETLRFPVGERGGFLIQIAASTNGLSGRGARSEVAARALGWIPYSASSGTGSSPGDHARCGSRSSPPPFGHHAVGRQPGIAHGHQDLIQHVPARAASRRLR